MSTNITNTARVIEVGDATAGIAVPDLAGTVRFFSAQSPFDRLDGRVFPSFDEALRAARGLIQSRCWTRRGKPPRPQRAEGNLTSELMLAAPGPLRQL